MAIFVLLVMLFLSSSGAANAANTYDYMQLVLQWPATFCYNNPDCSPNFPRGTFTIHGLWPSNYSTLEYKCVGTPFDPAEMFAAENHGLRDYFLPQAWPQLKAGYTNLGFWSYEYNKHGTCSENNLKQMDYFRQAYWGWIRFNPYNLFGASPKQIYPGNYYYTADIEAAIQMVTTEKPLLMCKKVKVGPVYNWLLQEVIICLDRWAVRVVPCGPRRSSCDGPILHYGY
ncbi:ribonuclease S-F11-like [Argentina anserina]|uniref:ribonuclease S-F11-like n=1 Tax=Argentina anserina TaxID=57926 RepID=UPI00217642AC|nr:ribonuclease S-F11-like [Potentilla anserina]